MKISVVVPVWNGREHLARLLETLASQTLSADEVVVVDNGSTDGAGDLAEAWGARVVRFAENRGFAAAVNRGVAEAGGELLAILNSDVMLEPGWMELLARAVTGGQAWFAVGLIVSARDAGTVDGGTIDGGTIDGTWDLVSRAMMPWRVGSGFPASAAEFQGDRPIEMASFTAILMRRELWRKVGPLDERFESYLEDVDFGLRCLAAGCGGKYIASARCRHVGSAALGRWGGESVRRMSRNQLFLLWKHVPADVRRRWGWNIFLGQALWGVVAARHGAAGEWWRGKREGWARRREFPDGAEVGASRLEAQERELLAWQRKLGPDSYWRWYAVLTGSGHEAE